MSIYGMNEYDSNRIGPTVRQKMIHDVIQLNLTNTNLIQRLNT